jgi:hypothetical protein
MTAATAALHAATPLTPAASTPGGSAPLLPGAGVGVFSRDSAEDRALLVNFLLHCADLCTPLFPPAVSARVTEELSAEFSRQAELERAAGLPVTVMLATDALSKAKMESGFISFAVRPLYVTLVRAARHACEMRACVCMC